MKRQPMILAGTALGLLMASAPLEAFPLQRGFDPGLAQGTTSRPLILAQAECEEGAENCAPGEPGPAEKAVPAEPEQKARKKKQKEAAEPAPEQQAAPEAKPEQEAAPAEAQAPAEEQKPRRKKQNEATEPAPEQQAAPERQPHHQAAPAEVEQEPRRRKNKEAAEPAPEQQAAPEPQPKQKTVPADTQAPAKAEQKPRRKDRDKQQAAPAETPETAPTPAEQPAQAGNDNRKPGAKPTARKPAPEKPASSGQPAEDQQATEGQAPADIDAAPVLDSQKELRRQRGNGKTGDRAGNERQRNQPANQNEEQTATPPPASDEAAQQAIRPEKIERATEERGKRRERAPDFRREERRDGVDVLKEIGNRVIIELGGRTMVENTDRSRLRHDARDVYYEDLPRGRTRETIERRNGDRIVTIRNRDGDIIQRSRITPEGREYILNYVDERHYDDRREWRDPGEDLPPMRLTIPRNQYILDSESVDDPDDYYEFLEQPPVEPVQRLYSVQEVKRSARVRDIARRVDLDTLTFDTGSAAISRSEVQKLAGVANAMERLLDRNPAETFLIEGHTDAVGSDDSNLALSDERAEAVAEALTDTFGIPPENLTTQGYGEQYLKVDTSGPERQNRRVAIRRITSLVAPVANAD